MSSFYSCVNFNAKWLKSMQNKATDLFSDWAEIGRDKGMVDAHDPAVSEILDKIQKSKNFIYFH